MRRWLGFGGFIGALSALTAPLVGGCSSASNPYPDVNSFCQGEAAAYCQSGGVLGACVVSPTACETAQQAACNTAATQAMASGTRVYNPANAQACVDAVTAAFTSSTAGVLSVPYATLQQLAVTCEEDVFTGSVMRDGTCKTDDDCAQPSPPNGTLPGFVCSPVVPLSTTMECEPSTSVATGGFCENPGSVCTDPGTYCVEVMNGGFECQPGAGLGTSCTAEKGCAAGGFCQINAGETTGKCETPASLGSACSSNANCASAAPYCDLNVSKGACELGLSFAVNSSDCKAFGG
jgi:hypothetical protein